MALIFMDGFDHYEIGELLTKYSIRAGSGHAMYVGRDGTGQSLRMGAQNSSVRKEFATTSDTVILGSAVYKYPSSANEDTLTVISINSGAYVAVHLVISDEGIITIKNNASVVIGTSTFQSVINNWSYMELKVKLGETDGTIELRVNGATVIAETAVDTSAGTDIPTSFTVHGGGNYGNPVRFDDVYLLDDTGTENNDFLGDVSVQTLYPVSDGANSDLTPSTGVDNYAVVDDSLLVPGGDYVSSDTIGDADTYEMSELGQFSDVYGVQVCCNVQNITMGERRIRTLCLSGAIPTNNEGSDFYVSATLLTALGIFEKEPTDDVDWTTANINSTEFGVKIQA